MSLKKTWGMTALAPALLAAGFCMTTAATAAPTQGDRSGKEVVDTVCAGCHATGKDGAPRLGDRAEWGKRAVVGLDKLTEHAINGVRKMPAHGGQAHLTDLEMSRAIAYMVSDGYTVDPKKPYAAPQRMSGKQLVEARCQECHGTGKNGAPRIGDMDAWSPRLQKGPDVLLKSAIRGHNAMPARAGMADLSDAEMKAALNYMLNQTTTAAKQKVNDADAASQK